MANLFDHIPQRPLLEGYEHWPKSFSREEWFRQTMTIIAGVIADIAEDLNDAELSLVKQPFISAGLL